MLPPSTFLIASPPAATETCAMAGSFGVRKVEDEIGVVVRSIRGQETSRGRLEHVYPTRSDHAGHPATAKVLSFEESSEEQP
jgi:hypothetical protein